MANKWNAEKRYAKAYIDPSDGSFVLEYDYKFKGATREALTDVVALYDSLLGSLGEYTR